MWDYARAFCELDRLKEAKEVLDELLAIQTRLYGPDAPQTQETARLRANVEAQSIRGVAMYYIHSYP